jgi:UDP-glucose 4-epimerase
MHQLSRGEGITIYGGEEKVLDFTFIDDCVDGIARGVYALGERKVANDTINLAYGQGNTLVRAAELIATELSVEPQIEIAPSLLGEVTHYVADVRKARELLGWEPQTPLDRGIPKAVAWFREWRAAHPEEDRPIEPERTPGEIEHGFKQPAPAGA